LIIAIFNPNHLLTAVLLSTQKNGIISAKIRVKHSYGESF